jgi:hypothetical protein
MPSKCGFHYLGRGADPADIASGMRIGKWVNNPPPSNLPSGFISVWRWVENPDNINDHFNKNPEEIAAWWVDKQSPHFVDIPKSAYIEGPNENACDNRQQADWFSRFEITRMQLMEAYGYKSCIFNFGTGRPSLPLDDPGGVDIWTGLLPALRYAKAYGHIVGMHGYNYDPHEVWNNLRYRRVYSWLPSDAQPKLVIGEWGLDGAKGRFRDSSWRSQYADPDAKYFEIIKEYDAEVRKDDYVLGFTIFTVGNDNNAEWKKFDIAGQPVEGMIRTYVKSQVGVVDTPLPPTPTPKFLPGQRVIVNANGILNSRVMPDATTPILSVRQPGDTGTILDGPQANGYAWYDIQWDDGNSGWSIGSRLGNYTDPLPEEPPDEEPPMSTNNLLRNPDMFSGGIQTIPGRNNMRFGRDWTFTFREGGPIGLPNEDVNSALLAPEMKFHGNNGQAGTEPISAAEQTLYFTADAPIIWHVLKLFGKQQWELSQTIDLPAGEYKFSIEIYPDVYSGAHVWAPDPLSAEWQLVGDAAWLNGATTPDSIKGDPTGDDQRKYFGRWIKLSKTYVHPGGALKVGVGFRARWGVENVGAFVRLASLVRVGVVPPVDPPGTGGTLTLAIVREMWTAVGEVLARHGA